MVKIFGKPRKDTRKAKAGETPAAAEPKDAAVKAAAAGASAGPAAGAGAGAAPSEKVVGSAGAAPAARKTTTTRATAATKTAATATGGATGATSRTRRAPSTRPPRRDWAAEAAAMPIDAPSPTPSSLAVAPSLANGDGTDGTDTAGVKRRRGARGGRGRKKPGTNGTSAAAEVEAFEAEPGTLEAVVAQQAAVLEQFTRETTAALKSLQAAIGDVQRTVSREPSGVTFAPEGSQTATQRVGIFVDVPNLIYAAERRKIDMDFGKVLEFFTRGRQLVRATAYAPITDDPQAKLESQRFAHHFIGHPYRIVTKPLKRFADGSMKANFDIELAVDILTMSERLDVVVLMSGDGDFVRVVELVESRGVRVEVAAFAEAAANELKTVADVFVDFGQHLEAFRK